MSTAMEEAEDTKLKLTQLEVKVNELERLVNELSSDAKKVLMDVRAIISEMENPLNFLKGLGIEELVTSVAENLTESKVADFVDSRVNTLVKNVLEGKVKTLLTEKLSETMETEVNKLLDDKLKKISEGLNVGVKDEQLKSIIRGELKELLKDHWWINTSSEEFKKSLEDILREILPSMVSSDIKPAGVGKAEAYKRSSGLTEERDITVLITLYAACLLLLFGRKNVEAVLDEYYKNNWLPSELKMLILRSIHTLNIPNVTDEGAAGVEGHIVALYMLNRLKEGIASSLEFTILLILLSKLYTTRTG